jgi:putative exporter of polyketide antibiotics
VPFTGPDAPATAIMTVATLALAVVGVVGYRRRDL